MQSVRFASLVLASFVTLLTACEDPCSAPSTEIELFTEDRAPLPSGVYEIEVELAGESSRSQCQVSQSDVGEVDCTSEGGDAEDGPPALTLWVTETGITGTLHERSGPLTISVFHDGVELARQEMVLETQRVEFPGNGRPVKCEMLTPRVEVELVYEQS
jgi:hypothetical protein